MAGEATLTIRDKQWGVSVATAPWELTKGLGGLASMPAGRGMLFDLGYPQTIQVTTVPMLFPLDVAFLSDSLVVTEVYRDIQPGYLVTSKLPARYFLEVNAKELEGIDSGDRASVELLPPSAVMAAPDWTSAVVGFMGFMVMGVLLVTVVKDVVKGALEEPKKRPELLLQTEARFKPGEILRYKGEKVRVLEHIGGRVSVWIPSRQEEVWVKQEKLERVGSPAPAQRQKRVVLSSLLFEELTGAGLGYVAKEISAVVDKRSRDNAWLELWDGTTFDRVGGYREHIGLTIPRLVVAEVGIRTGLSYNECVAIGERINSKLKEADTIVLDDGTAFRKSYVPVKRSPAVLLAMEESMEYRVEENKPYGTWAVVDLFPGRTVRSPFSTREEAIKREEEIGKYYGWKLKRVELTPEEVALLGPQCFPKRTEALEKLKGYDVIHVHDDGDLTVRSRGKFYVVTTEGQTFEQKEYLAQTRESSKCVKPTRVISTEKRPHRAPGELEYFADSPEFLTQTLDATGYRDRIDTAFEEAIRRAKGGQFKTGEVGR